MKIEGALLEKLTNAGIEIEVVEKEIIDDNGDIEIVKTHIAKFPCNREYVMLRFSNRIDLGTYLSADFEYFKFIKDYEAIWSSKFRVIECELQSVSSRFATSLSNSILYRTLALAFGKKNDEEKEEYTRFEFEKSENNCLITIGGASIEYAILSILKNRGISLENTRRRITLRIENIDVSTHDQAKKVLEKLGNSILFKLDLTSSIECKLAEDRETKRRFQRRRKMKNDVDKTFPIFEYDSEPMSLYWYAKSANEMPLLQFLAFYQILEFYFPIFSQKEIHQQIKNIIKDPRFNPNKDTDITRIINAITPNRSQSFGTELEQLKSTIRNCVRSNELREFINENEELIEFFKGKKAKNLASKTLSVTSPNADIVTECAERIYEIRCRVVHTKAADNSDLLLPFSPELKDLIFDILILEFVAKNILIATSRVLKL